MTKAAFYRCWISLLSLLLSGLLAGPVRAEVVVLDDAFTSLVMGRHVRVLEDKTAQLGLTDILRKPAQSPEWSDRHREDLNFAYSNSAFWLRGELVNRASHRSEWLLSLRYPLLDYVDLYVVWPDGRVQHHASGDRRPFASRPVRDRNFYFPLTLRPGEQVQVFARVQSQGSLQAPLEISTTHHQEQRAQNEQLLLGLYSGALLAMLLYNLLLYASLRDRAYLYYVVYIVLFGIAQSTLSGLAYEYLWPNSPNWGNQATPVFMGLAGWSLVLFSRQFLDTRRHAAHIDAVMRVLQWLFVAIVPATFVMSYAWSVKLATLLTLVAPLLMLILTAILLRQGVRQAYYFLWAFGGLLLGFMLNSLNRFGLMESSLLTDYGMQIGSLLEITLLSFALAHRLKLSQQANMRLQRAHAAELEASVLARTRDLDNAMAELTRANARLQDLSVRDSLTGLHNRQFLAERLPEMWRFAQRWHQPLSVLMIDIDHFKQVNDQHGHAAGDEALRQVAAVLSEIIRRPGDHAVRYGGEEFLVILPQTDLAGAAHMAESIRLGVQSLDVHYADQAIVLTVSIGVACTIPAAHSLPETLLNAADELLYEAKHGGRNRCALQPQALEELTMSPGSVLSE
ncbi:MAG: GGDEF domain-containing protein [Burkholderiales bacterium]|nr:GGDEF domain-containing protein [Burkholderiales bacterium]